MTYVDIQSKVSQVLIDANVAGGNVIITNEIKVVTPPQICLTQTSLIGNTCEGFYEALIVVNCIASTEQAAGVLADTVLNVLDGYGGNGIADVMHVSTIPVRTEVTAPVTHTYAMTFRIVYQNLKP